MTATLAEDLAGARVVQAFRRERGNAEYLRRDQRHLPAAPTYRTVQLNAWYFPFVGLLGSVSTAIVLGLRRHALLRRRDHDRHAVRVHALPGELLRPDPGALAALQHVPGGQRGARQDLRRHGHAARAARRRGRAGRCRRSRARSSSRTCTSPTARAPRCCTASTSASPPARPSRSSVTRAPASRRS